MMEQLELENSAGTTKGPVISISLSSVLPLPPKRLYVDTNPAGSTHFKYR